MQKRWFAFFITALAGLIENSLAVEAESDVLSLPEARYEWAGNAPETLRVGDDLSLRLEGSALETSAGKQIFLRVIQGSSSLLDLGLVITPERWEGSSLLLRVVPLKSGTLSLPMLLLSLENPEAAAFARTDTMKLEVQTAIAPDDPNPKEAVPPKMPVELGFPVTAAIVSSGVLLVLLAAVIYLIRRLRRRKQELEQKAVAAEKPLPPDEQALKALSELEKKEFWKKREHKKHFFGISEIMKEYIGSRYEFDALESTTQELFLVLERKAIPTATLREMVLLFESLDRVKFTDYLPGEQEYLKGLEEARAWVETTRFPHAV